MKNLLMVILLLWGIVFAEHGDLNWTVTEIMNTTSTLMIPCDSNDVLDQLVATLGSMNGIADTWCGRNEGTPSLFRSLYGLALLTVDPAMEGPWTSRLSGQVNYNIMAISEAEYYATFIINPGSTDLYIIIYQFR